MRYSWSLSLRIASIDADQRVATLASGSTLRYDKLVPSPGIEMIWSEVDGLEAASRAGRIAGETGLALERALVQSEMAELRVD